MTLFDHLNNIAFNKQPLDPNNDEDMKSYSPYMINRFISMCEMYIPFVNEINKYPDIQKEVHQRFYTSLIPKRKQFFKYIKKSDSINIDDIRIIAEYFEVGLKEAKYYLTFLSKEHVKEIVNKFVDVK